MVRRYMSALSVTRAIARYRWVILGLVLVAQCSSSFVLSAPSPLAPLFQDELGLTKAQVGLLASATSTGAWATLLVGGLLTDRFGIRAIISLSLVVTGLALSGMQFVESFPQALVLMFAAGLSRGSVAPGTTKAVLVWFSTRSRATAMGIKQMGFPLSGVIAGLVLPTVGLALGWRLAMAIPGIAIAAVGVAYWILYRDVPGAERTSNDRSMSAFRAILDLLHDHVLRTLCSVAFLFFLIQIAMVAYIALYMDEVVLVGAFPDRGARLVAAGGFLAVCQIGGALGRAGWGLVSDLLFRGRRMAVLALIGGLSCALSLATALLAPVLPIPVLTMLVFAYGATNLGWNGVYNAVLGESLDRKHAATGVGLTMTFTELGTISGAPLFGFVVDLAHSYQVAWVSLAAVAAVATVMAIFAMRGPLAGR